jgi:signal transduction histidine kinase
LQIGNISAITSRNDLVWIGGESGLAVFESGRIQMLATSAPDNIGGIGGIVEEPNGDLWLNQATGIVHISANQIAEKLRHHDGLLGHEVFDVRDGVLGVATQLRPIPSAVRGQDGRIWFSGSEGVTWIDPAHIYCNTVPPPVSIRSVTVNGHLYDSAQPIAFPVLPSNVQIDYEGLSLSIAERVRFRYQLEGYEKDWQDANGRRSAFYNRLGPGKYRFHVIASNNDGVWNKTGATLAFTVPPTYYQTLWFRVICVAAGCALLWLLYLMRLRQIAGAMQGKFEERLKERTRIAQELHDTLLQGFLSACMHAQVANEQLPPDSQAKATMSRAIQSMRQVIEEGRNAVRGLRSSSSQSLDLEQSLLRVQQEIGSIGGASEAPEFRVMVQGRERALHPLLRDELYRIGQEALINAFRHANAKTIEVHLDYSHSKLHMIIRDDGCGIDSQVLQSGRDGHWGLSGMRERADRIGAHLHIETSAAGTEIAISVPSNIAFIDHETVRRRWFDRLRGSKYASTGTRKRAI